MKESPTIDAKEAYEILGIADKKPLTAKQAWWVFRTTHGIKTIPGTRRWSRAKTVEAITK